MLVRPVAPPMADGADATGSRRDLALLARRVGCAVEELPALLAKLSATPAGERRREALRLFFAEDLTCKTIAERQGVTRSWVSTLVEDGIARLVHARAGRLGIPPALWGPLGLLPTPGDAAGPRTCAQVLRRPGYGRARLAGLHRQLAARGLRMACGCPAVLCEAARRCFAPPKPRRDGPEPARPAPAPRLPAEAFEGREGLTPESFAGWLKARPADHGRFELRAGRVSVLPAPVSPHREAGWAATPLLATAQAEQFYAPGRLADVGYTPERALALARPFRPAPPALASAAPGRNDPCGCKSGKKYKRCCGAG